MKAKVIETRRERLWRMTEMKHGRKGAELDFRARADARDRAKISREQGYATKIVPVLVETRVTVLPGGN